MAAPRGQGISVTPDDPMFEYVVEPGVLPLVKALIEAGYCTLSSCEGHRDEMTRYVTVCFPTKEERASFSQKFRPMFNVWIEETDSFCTTTSNPPTKFSREREVEYLNGFFNESQDSWFFATLKIGCLTTASWLWLRRLAWDWTMKKVIGRI